MILHKNLIFFLDRLNRFLYFWVLKYQISACRFCSPRLLFWVFTVLVSTSLTLGRQWKGWEKSNNYMSHSFSVLSTKSTNDNIDYNHYSNQIKKTDFVKLCRFRARSFGVIWITISDPRSVWIMVHQTDGSTLLMDSSGPLMHHDPDRSWMTDPVQITSKECTLSVQWLFLKRTTSFSQYF